jgi:hypothetical protein
MILSKITSGKKTNEVFIMSEIIDVLTPLLSKCISFTVNNAVDYVDAAYPGVPYTAKNAHGDTKFQPGDSFVLLSAGVILPEAFTFWKNPALTDEALPFFGIVPYGVTSTDQYYNPNIPGGSIYLPMENFECVFDVFFDCRAAYDIAHPLINLFSEKFTLSLAPFAAMDHISMQNVPAAMNGKVFRAVPFIKIMHNLPLVP